MAADKTLRNDIAKDIHENGLSFAKAGKKYGIPTSTARYYYTSYIKENGLKSKKKDEVIVRVEKDINIDALRELSKDQLIDEIIKAKVEAERLKKGYMVKGGGQEKEFISLKKQSSR